MNGTPAALPELWGGIECTVNRIGDRYTDQVVLTGHHGRIEDLDRFATLGLAALRYPILWERVAPGRPDECDWGWSDARLGRLRDLGIRPIAGLVHHGSGPRYTNLLDPNFAEALGRFAGEAAARYDWVRDWTPVNEPLTTARFSALYGHWYPHAKDERLFWLALFNQVAGVRAAMKAIRVVRPDARLIQTDDLGHTYATPPLAKQAAFDNERRWAGWDLLFGRLTRDHPLWGRLCGFGFADQLHTALEDPCPPDIVGLNHYVTSDRFLDHRTKRYPPERCGGNGRQAYADVEAVRVLEPPPCGFATAIAAAWARYRTPIALTEVHIGCTREEQMRFAAEAWDAALAARSAGVDLQAVTAWALLGNIGWDTLLTGGGTYEPGVFDITDGTPNATGLASLWRALARGQERPVIAEQDGWWRRNTRFLYPPAATEVDVVHRPLARAAAYILVSAPNEAWQKAFAAAGTLRNLNVHIGELTWSADRRDKPASLDAIDQRPCARIDVRLYACSSTEERNSPGSIEAGSLACSSGALPLITITSTTNAAARTIEDLIDQALDAAIDADARLRYNTAINSEFYPAGNERADLSLMPELTPNTTHSAYPL